MTIKRSLFSLARSVKRQFNLKADVKAESGIGVLIIFIALVLVAAVAASVLIHTAGILQQRAQSTGTSTISQVSTGLVVNEIVGYDSASPAESGGIKYLAIMVSDNTGGNPVDLGNTSLTLTINGVTSVLVYNSSVFTDLAGSGSKNLFGVSQWSYLNKTSKDSTSFGVIGIADPQHALDNNYPVITPGAEAAIIVNVTNSFGTNLTQNTQVTGQLTPETGVSTTINFVAPEAFNTNTITLT
jgi:flagellin FlaB